MVFHIHNDYVKQQENDCRLPKQSDELRTFWDDPKTTRGTTSPAFHTRWRRGHEIRDAEQQRFAHARRLEVNMPFTLVQS